MLAGILVLLVFTFPETLFSREDFSNLERRSYWAKTFYWGKVLNRPLRLRDFGNNFKMLRYWAVVIPCVYYAT